MMRLFATLATILLSAPFSAYADIDATVSVNPTYPAPFQKVVLTLSSYSFDVNVAHITWSSNNKTLLSGLGQKTISITMGDAGQALPLTYTAITADGSSVSGSVLLSPQSVDLLYETPESYVPPFYQGRALPGEGSSVKMVALPTIYENGSRVSSGNLSYNWYVNGEYLDRASGIGRQSALIGMEYLSNSTDVRVLVRGPLGTAAEKTVSIYPHEVLPLLYRYDDVLGSDFASAIVGRLELAKDITLSLEPYYLSSRGSLASTASYEWFLNGLAVTPMEKTLLALKPQKDAVGARTLTVLVQNSRRLLQKAQSDIEVIFDARQ